LPEKEIKEKRTNPCAQRSIGTKHRDQTLRNQKTFYQVESCSRSVRSTAPDRAASGFSNQENDWHGMDHGNVFGFCEVI
jgi:hypothetical protein